MKVEKGKVRAPEMVRMGLKSPRLSFRRLRGHDVTPSRSTLPAGVLSHP